jgi:hypothetical protein
MKNINSENNNSVDLENNNSLSKIQKLIKYFTNIHILSINYLTEIINNLDNKETINKLEVNIKNNKFNTYIKELNKNNKNEHYIIFNNINLAKYEIDKLIKLINEINIYDEKTLLSDTSKNNINQNKITILDIYKKINKKYENTIELFINYIVTIFNYTYENYIELTKYFKNNDLIIDLYVEIVKKYLSKENINFNELIQFNNNYFKLDTLNKYLDNINIKYNNNKLDDFNYIFKNNITINKKYNNIINKYTKYSIYKDYSNLNDLFSELYNGNYKFKNNNLDKKNLEYIYQILKDFYKIEKTFVNIIILDADLDTITYNLTNLLDKDYQIDKNQGINIDYINKTKTIVNKEEFKKMPNLYKKFKNDIYISNYHTIINIHNYNLKDKFDKLELLLKTQYLLIFKLNGIFYIMQDNLNSIFIKHNKINTLLQNKPKYYIENYNSILEHNIIQNIEKQNMLESYNNKIALDYKNISNIDNLELKNLIINKIKKEIITNKKSKSENIELIIKIIIDEIYKYIKKVNNIEFTSEIYLTYISNISSLTYKIRKELNDKYDDNILFNIDNILDNIYSNIISINNNILDKSYFVQL